jgi:5-methylcytosine-specific restriction enzyme B
MNNFEVLADRFRSVLLDESSIESSDKKLWNKTNINNLWLALSKNEKIDKRGFIEKLIEQIDQVPQHTDATKGSDEQLELVPLICEILGIYYAYPSNISRRGKRGTLSDFLKGECDCIKSQALTPDDFPITLSAFGYGGVGSGGMGFNTNRQKEIYYLIEFLNHWFELPLTQRDSLLNFNNRNELQNMLDELSGNRLPQVRHLILFYIHPEYYTRIISTGNKRNIASVFSEFIDKDKLDAECSPVKPSWNIDQRIKVISSALEKFRGKPTDFYNKDIQPFWNSKAQEGLPDIDSELLEYKKQIVLYGPPGTGKTYTAKILAAEAIRYRLSQTIGVKIFDDDGQEMLSFALENNIHRLQLHPAYSYEEFIRGLQIKDGDTSYVNGYLLKLLNTMGTRPEIPHVLILDEINRVDLSRLFGECFSALENRGESIDLPGANDDEVVKLCIPDNLYIIGTMNLIDHSVEQLDFALRRRFLWVEATYSAESLLSICESRWHKLSWSGRREFKWEEVESDFKRLVKAATALNATIATEEELGKDFMLGHVFFLDAVSFLYTFLNSYSNSLSNYLFKSKGAWREPISKLWKLSLYPLLKEYLAGLEKSQQEDIIQKLKASFKPES